MKIKILQKNGCAILAVLCLIGLCLPFVDAYNGAERSIYSNVKNAKDYEVDYECMKYLVNILKENMQKMSRIY